MSIDSSSSVEAGLPRAAELRVPTTLRPKLLVVVDTEEEFDWGAPFSRSNTGVTAMTHVHRGQALFDRYRIRPTYVVDYPVVAQDAGAGPLLEIFQDGRCSIGAHLHPWVNPPHDEQLSRWNSFCCNLPVPLQRAKLETLTGAIGERFHTRPAVFKAGRYGVGAAMVRLLEEFEYTVDTSVCPCMDFSGEGGPSFTAFDSKPFFLTSGVLELPCCIDFVGWSGPLGSALHRVASQPALTRFRAVGALARTGVVNRIMLSPEGNTFEEMRALTRSLVQRGCRFLTLSFHSPSLAVGYTPYVRTEADLRMFLDTIERYLEFFINDLRGEPAVHADVRAVAPQYMGPV